jgi:hypothetical protein
LWARYLSLYSDWLRAGRSGNRIPVGARFFAHVQTDPGAHPASCTMGTGSFPGAKRPRRGDNQPPPSITEVTKGLSYTSIHPLGQFRPGTRLLYLYLLLLLLSQKALGHYLMPKESLFKPKVFLVCFSHLRKFRDST